MSSGIAYRLRQLVHLYSRTEAATRIAQLQAALAPLNLADPEDARWAQSLEVQICVLRHRMADIDAQLAAASRPTTATTGGLTHV